MTTPDSREKDGLVKVADLKQLRTGGSVLVKIGELEIAVLNLGDKIYAFINSCPHQHTRLVDSSGGQINGRVITCPMHGWSYDLHDGRSLNGSGRLKMVKLEIIGDDLFFNPEELNGHW